MEENKGKKGERLAESFLIKKGYKILARNYLYWPFGQQKKGEIDIVCKKDNRIIFVEVKSLTKNCSYFYPELKINQDKKKKIILAAEHWLLKNKIPLSSPWQIDIITIENLEDDIKIHHFENAFPDIRFSRFF